ncbi:hypothetical protein EBU95_05320 [bacterium]|nr:hypothetical protein [bacterium]
MIINSAGNVGINTTVPTALVDVNGTLRAAVGITTGALRVTGESVLTGNVTTGAVYINTSASIVGVDITPSAGDIVKERTFIASNNVSSPQNITGLSFDSAVVRSFVATLSVYINATTKLFAVYQLMGVQKDNTWVLNSSFAGDKITDIAFSITNNGQVQYTHADIPGWVITKMNFKANTTSV